MRTIRSFGLSILLLAGAALNQSAQAAAFCVFSPASFQSALTSAQSNGQATNVIKVWAGSYNLTAGLQYITSTTSNLYVVGGYSMGCASKTAAVTQLNGQHAVRPLLIFAANTNIHIEGLDFVSGLSTNNRGGGLSVESHNGSVSVLRNSFYGNRANDYGGGLFVSAGVGLRVSNNLFFSNSARVDGAAELVSTSPESYVTNNTVSGNSADLATSAGGLNLTGSTHYNVSNNIVWNNTANGAADFRSNSSHLRLNNDIGVSTGLAPDAASAGDLSIVPVFEPCGFLCISFALPGNSPLVDAGQTFPPGGLLGIDLRGNARVVGGVVDMGAVEFKPQFASQFEESD